MVIIVLICCRSTPTGQPSCSSGTCRATDSGLSSATLSRSATSPSAAARRSSSGARAAGIWRSGGGLARTACSSFAAPSPFASASTTESSPSFSTKASTAAGARLAGPSTTSRSPPAATSAWPPSKSGTSNDYCSLVTNFVWLWTNLDQLVVTLMTGS